MLTAAPNCSTFLEARYTSGSYHEQNPDWHVTDSPWKARQIAALLQRHHLPLHSICEVGCGAGEILVQLRDLLPPHIEFFGYDISPQALELCRVREGERLHFALGDPFAAGRRYSLAMAIDVFEHVPDYLSFLKNMKPVADYKLFHIPLDISVSSVLRSQPLLSVRRSVGHLHYFTAETALATLEDCGYQIVDRSFTPCALAADSNQRRLKTRLANLPRRIFRLLGDGFAARLVGGFSLLVLAR